MSDSIKVNSDVKMLTRYAMGLTPEEQRISVNDPSTAVWTIGLEKGIRGTTTLLPDLKDPKKALQEQKQIEQGLKGATSRETYDNFMRNMEIQDLEKRFRPVTGDPTKELQRLQKADNIKKLSAEVKKLSGAEKTKKLRELQRAFSEFQQTEGMSKAEAKKFLSELTDKKLAKNLKNAQKAVNEFNKSKYYDDVRRLIGEAKTLKGKDYADKMKEIEKAIADANQKIHIEKTTGSLKPVSKTGKAWNKVKTVTGYNKAKGAINTALTKSSALRTVAKFGRANAATAVGIDAALSIPEIIATKQTFDTIDENGNPVKPGEGTGTQKALKQTGRVVATAGAQLGAYAIGAKAGTAAVAALWAAKGAALGSVAPGVGTAIGAVVGIGVGLVSCWLAGKAMEKALGKSELDQLQDKLENEPANQTALAAQKDDRVLEEVLLTAKARYEQDPETNKKIEKAYENVVTAYQNGEIGSAADARVLTKPEQTETPAAASSQPASDSDTEQRTQTPVLGAASAQKTQKSEKTENPENSGKSSDESSETSPAEKYRETIVKLDFILKTLESMYNQNSTGMNMYGIYSNPMMMSNPFIMPQFGMYA